MRRSEQKGKGSTSWYALIVMFTNHGLHGLSARHRGLLAHQGCYCPETVSPQTGDFPEDGWTDMGLELHLVHDGEMLLLLVPHFLTNKE